MASTLAPRRYMSGLSAIVGAGSELDLAEFRTKDAHSCMLAAVGISTRHASVGAHRA
jgi:hypothetical protein